MSDSSHPMMRPRLLIADDHGIEAEGLRSLLERNYDVIGVVQDGRQLLAEAPRLKPDVIVLDIGMPQLNGLDAGERLKSSCPAAKLVFLTMKDDANLAAAALKLGAVGYVLKHAAASELLEAVSAVLQGRSYVTAKLRPENWAIREARARQFSKDLTPRQQVASCQTEQLDLVSSFQASVPDGSRWLVDKNISVRAFDSEKGQLVERPRILLADDHHPVLNRVIALLKTQFEVVGSVSDGGALVREAQRLQPDVIVLDITMPILTGIEAARELHEAGSKAKLVFLTVHQDPAFARECFAEGALGYVTKSRMVTDLIPAIKEALFSRRFVSPSVTH